MHEHHHHHGAAAAPADIPSSVPPSAACQHDDHFALARLALTIAILVEITLLITTIDVQRVRLPGSANLRTWYPPPRLRPPLI